MPEGEEEKLKEMSFLDHLEELRTAIISSLIAWVTVSIVLWFFSRYLLNFLLADLPVESLYFTSPIGAFMIRIKLSFVVGFLVAFPYILFRIWWFVSPGLFSRERKVVVPLITASTVLFYVGVLFAYWILIPIVLRFLVRFGTDLLQPLLSVEKYFGFVARLCFAFGVVFQLPLVIIFLVSVGLVSAGTLLKQWRWAVIVIFTASAVLTPPDIASQLLMGVPLVVLFLSSALIGLVIERKKRGGG